jgi:hypothetical protein
MRRRPTMEPTTAPAIMPPLDPFPDEISASGVGVDIAVSEDTMDAVDVMVVNCPAGMTKLGDASGVVVVVAATVSVINGMTEVKGGGSKDCCKPATIQGWG